MTFKRKEKKGRKAQLADCRLVVMVVVVVVVVVMVMF
jgi:t-SNARE complex subunit (syntaxin)